jgi:phosphoglycolate phosphatase-like HAD superfamily hydrolase
MSARQGRIERNTRPGLWMFDFDNTLAPLERSVDWAASRRELQAWLTERGVAPGLFEEFPRRNLVLYEALRARLSAGARSARAVLAGAHLTDGPAIDDAANRALLEGASAIIERHELAGVSAVTPAPGALELLKSLNMAGAVIAVVTSNSSRTVAAWLSAHRAEAMVRTIVGRDSGLALKPSPATLELALKLCATAPADAAFVGDTDTDFVAATALGVRFYGVNAKSEGRDRLIALGATEVFSSPAALATHLGLAELETRIGS